ncbi:MAG: bacteriohopanetetrol glucosamine biosynthesis glycosyltransferase HpnI [Bryobacteraceae bacterium]
MAILLALLVAGEIAYSLLSIVAARSYLAVRPSPLKRADPISILKPLSGLDRDLELNLRSFFEQEYPEFEILFAVREAHDPALAVVEKLRAEFPRIPSRILITGEPPAANAKVFSLGRMLAEAKHELIVMSDSDVRVTPSMLRTIAAEFQDPGVGLATCPYRAVPGPSFWSELEAAGMNTDFLGGILVVRMLEGMRFAIGPTIAARREALDAIGGFERLKDYLAEDFAMGKFAAEAGHRVILSSYVIEHHIGEPELRRNAAHRLRWTRSTRRSRPLGYLGQLFTMPLPLSILLCIAAPSWWPTAVAAVAVRFTAARFISNRVLGLRLNWAILPIEDLVAFGFWVAGFFGNTIVWRGRKYRVDAEGRIEPIAG